jgi:hypothetical protein
MGGWMRVERNADMPKRQAGLGPNGEWAAKSRKSRKSRRGLQGPRETEGPYGMRRAEWERRGAIDYENEDEEEKGTGTLSCSQ